MSMSMSIFQNQSTTIWQYPRPLTFNWNVKMKIFCQSFYIFKSFDQPFRFHTVISYVMDPVVSWSAIKVRKDKAYFVESFQV